MVDIILTKLGPSTVTAIGAASASSLEFLRLFLNTDQIEQNAEDFSQEISTLPIFLLRQLETALCSTSTASFRPACLALALISAYQQNPPLELDEPTMQNYGAFQKLQYIQLTDLFNLANFCKVSIIPWCCGVTSLFVSNVISLYRLAGLMLICALKLY